MNRSQRIVVLSACLTVAGALFWSFAGDLWWWQLRREPTAEQWAYGERPKPDLTLDPMRQALPGVVIPLALLAAGVVVLMGGRTSPPEG